MSLSGAIGRNIYKFDIDRSKNPAFQSNPDWVLCLCSKKAIYLSPKKSPEQVARLFGTEILWNAPGFIAGPQEYMSRCAD